MKHVVSEIQQQPSLHAELAVATRRVGDIVKGIYPSKIFKIANARCHVGRLVRHSLPCISPLEATP